MTLKLDTVRNQIIIADIISINDASYVLLMDYEEMGLFPGKINGEFELERIRIPLNFMGKDVNIDKGQSEKEGTKQGKIHLTLQWYEVQLE